MELTPAQQQVVDHRDGPLRVRGGAGTGKTTVLTQRISRLVKQKVAQPHEILAITYTNAAAEEMQDRVMSDPETRQLLEELMRRLGQQPPDS